MKADSPMPKIVSASPQAAWLAASSSAKKAKISAMPAPASAPAGRPMAAPCPLSTAAANPAMAPASIMPSTPRLMTPVRSVTSSPRPAKISGTAAARVPARMGTMCSIMALCSRVHVASGRRRRLSTKASAPSRKKSSMPWKIPVIAAGSCRATCAASPPR